MALRGSLASGVASPGGHRAAAEPGSKGRRYAAERAEADCPAERRELYAIIDEEINRLPEKYRRPLVLCYLEGLTQDAAARQLRWKTDVLRGRLERARLCLRGKLARKGVAPAATLALAQWLKLPAEARLTSALLDATVGNAYRELTVGNVSGTVAATSAVTLAGEVVRRQFMGRAVLVAALLAGGTLTLAPSGLLEGSRTGRILHGHPRLRQHRTPAGPGQPGRRSTFASWNRVPARRSRASV